MERFISRKKAQKTQRAQRSLDFGFWSLGARCVPLLGALGVLAAHLKSVSAQDDLQNLLAAPQLPPYQWFASTDPKNQNQDYLLLKPGETRRIPLAAGRLVRLWSTAFEPDKIVLTLQNGNSVELLRDGKTKFGNFYKKAFSLYPTKSTPDSVRSLRSDAVLVVTNRATAPNKFFYQVTVRGKSAAVVASAPLPTPLPELQPDEVPPQGQVEPQHDYEIWRADGPGVISSIVLTITPATLETFQNVHLRARWDGQSTPAVDVPLLALAGQFFSRDPLRAGPASFDGKTLRLAWPMPFRAGARLSLYNKGKQTIQLCCVLDTDNQVRMIRPSASLLATRFCAAYGSARTQRGKPLQILQANGEGAFVGLALGIRPVPETVRFNFAYLEGNETIIADDKKYEGTGTEDFFNSAWYFPDNPFAQPYHGLTFKKTPPPQVSAYRLMIPDAVPFKKSLKFELEHGNGNNSNDLEYRWVAFWYQKPPLKFQILDALDKSSRTAASGGARVNRGRDALWKLVFVALAAALFVVLFRSIARSRRT